MPSHLTAFHGLPVVDFRGPDDLPPTGSVAWRIRVDPWEDEANSFKEHWELFLDTVDPAEVRAVVFGAWAEMYDEEPVSELALAVAAADRLSGLEAFFFGDIEAEESEISWIEQTDVTPLLLAYPGLREFGARGGYGLRMTPLEHAGLRTLRFESGGLPAQAVQGLSDSRLPALENLELWLGVSAYGGTVTLPDLAPILSGSLFPALRHLGLQDSEIQDEIAAAIAAAPVVAQLESLSLSMGTLSDTGAEALLTGQPLTHLKRLDLDHHFISTPMLGRLRNALEPAGVDVEVSRQKEPDRWDGGRDWRYVAVSE
jgi:hypothetical protein